MIEKTCKYCAHYDEDPINGPCRDCRAGSQWQERDKRPAPPPLSTIAGGVKHDAGKLPIHLIAPELLTALAEILDFGAKKYGDRNWEKGMAWHRPFSAAMRHLWAWWRGAGPDEETGKSHLWHAACCVMFLVAYEARQIGTDDRPKEG